MYPNLEYSPESVEEAKDWLSYQYWKHANPGILDIDSLQLIFTLAVCWPEWKDKVWYPFALSDIFRSPEKHIPDGLGKTIANKLSTYVFKTRDDILKAHSEVLDWLEGFIDDKSLRCVAALLGRSFYSFIDSQSFDYSMKNTMVLVQTSGQDWFVGQCAELVDTRCRLVDSWQIMNGGGNAQAVLDFGNPSSYNPCILLMDVCKVIPLSFDSLRKFSDRTKIDTYNQIITQVNEQLERTCQPA